MNSHLETDESKGEGKNEALQIHLCLHLFVKYLKRFNFANNFFCSLWRHGNFRKNAKQHCFIVWQQIMNKSFFDKKIFELKCEVFSLTQTFFLQNCLWVIKVAKIVGIHIHMKYKNAQKSSYTSKPLHRGAFCQFSFRWIYY